MLAPRRVPPCLTASVAPLKTRRKLTGPLAFPPVDRTSVSLGRSREKANPVPPPLLWMMAARLTASKIWSMESPTGRTKQAEYCRPLSLPAFISVGEFGRNAPSTISS